MVGFWSVGFGRLLRCGRCACAWLQFLRHYNAVSGACPRTQLQFLRHYNAVSGPVSMERQYDIETLQFLRHYNAVSGVRGQQGVPESISVAVFKALQCRFRWYVVTCRFSSVFGPHCERHQITLRHHHQSCQYPRSANLYSPVDSYGYTICERRRQEPSPPRRSQREKAPKTSL